MSNSWWCNYTSWWNLWFLGWRLTTGSTVQYTNGTGTPGVTPWASDANITVTEGHGGTYPTGLNFSPRNWNGSVVYGDPNACCLYICLVNRRYY